MELYALPASPLPSPEEGEAEVFYPRRDYAGGFSLGSSPSGLECFLLDSGLQLKAQVLKGTEEYYSFWGKTGRSLRRGGRGEDHFSPSSSEGRETGVFLSLGGEEEEISLFSSGRSPLPSFFLGEEGVKGKGEVTFSFWGGLLIPFLQGRGRLSFFLIVGWGGTFFFPESEDSSPPMMVWQRSICSLS